MRTLPENAEEVRILNTENNTFYYFTLRKDRLTAFFQYLKENRSSGYPASIMPGISGCNVCAGLYLLRSEACTLPRKRHSRLAP